MRRLRAGELLALAGAGAVIGSLFAPWYQNSEQTFDAWDTFGPSVALLLAASCAALALVVATLVERSTAFPVWLGNWCVVLGVIAVVAALVRVLERPDHATKLCAGAWIALAGAVAILAGCYQALRDERVSLYDEATPPPRPRP